MIDFRFEDFADLIVWLCYLLYLCHLWPGIGFPRPSGGDPKELRKCLAGAFPLFLVVAADVDASSGNNHLQIPKLRLRLVTLETWSQLSLASLKSLSTLADLWLVL